MATDITVLRVEVVDADIQDDKSLNSKKSSRPKKSKFKSEDETNKNKQVESLRKRKHQIIQKIKDGYAEEKDLKQLDVIKKQQLNNVKRYGRNITSYLALGVQTYSQFKNVGYELSGATQTAVKQQRKADIANLALTTGVSAIIAPELIPIILIMKVINYQLALKKELFEIKKSVITSNITQRYLTKVIAERRF